MGPKGRHTYSGFLALQKQTQISLCTCICMHASDVTDSAFYYGPDKLYTSSCLQHKVISLKMGWVWIWVMGLS